MTSEEQDKLAPKHLPTRRRGNADHGHRCPMCWLTYANIKQHLTHTERVVNKDELKYLLQLANGHFKARLDCPVEKCSAKRILRLDKHLHAVHHLNTETVTNLMNVAKMRHSVQQLVLLRASNPNPPMVSYLDEINDSVIEEAVRRGEEAHAVGNSWQRGPRTSAPGSAQSLVATSESSPVDPHSSPVCAVSSSNRTNCGSETTTPISQGGGDRSTLVLPNSTPPRPRPGCANCQRLVTSVDIITGLLKSEVTKNKELQKIHSNVLKENAVKFRRRLPYSPSKAPKYVKLVNEYRSHIEGTTPSRKQKENAKQKATHITSFLEFMAEPFIPNSNLLFLTNLAKVRKFVGHLQKKQFKPTTLRVYLVDIMSFIKYVEEVSPECVKLSRKSFKALSVEIKARMRDIGRVVVCHQLQVRRSKTEKLLDSRRHHAFVKAAPRKISVALDVLERRRDKAAQRRFFGLLAGYVIATTGHRKGVVINMTTQEARCPEKAKNGNRVIRVSQHKTQRYYGQAAIPLTREEYSWFERYNNIRDEFPGGAKAVTFFHTASGGTLLKLAEFFQEQWESLNLGTAPTFNQLRSSVATYTRRQLGGKTYEKVAAFMCHDSQTAQRFYQADDPADETVRSRNLTLMAISTHAYKQRQKAARRQLREQEEDEERQQQEVEREEEDEQEVEQEEEDEQEEKDKQEEEDEPKEKDEPEEKNPIVLRRRSRRRFATDDAEAGRSQSDLESDEEGSDWRPTPTGLNSDEDSENCEVASRSAQDLSVLRLSSEDEGSERGSKVFPPCSSSTPKKRDKRVEARVVKRSSTPSTSRKPRKKPQTNYFPQEQKSDVQISLDTSSEEDTGIQVDDASPLDIIVLSDCETDDRPTLAADATTHNLTVKLNHAIVNVVTPKKPGSTLCEGSEVTVKLSPLTYSNSDDGFSTMSTQTEARLCPLSLPANQKGRRNRSIGPKPVKGGKGLSQYC